MKKFLAIALIAAVACSSVFATRIGVTYKDNEYILNTSTQITADDVAYFAGMYDALAAVKEGRQLYEIHQGIAQKTFLTASNEYDTEQKARYVAAFKDFMDNYTEGSDGEFSDIYPIYDSLMSEVPSYRSARLIVEFGQARFYPRNL